ncbi:hypothetical protein HY523_01835, partial [Candidatus Berkelbacteria bacterium]|nr:hypothetical protein [Candidatus Berkelbacteria bacterium]
MIFAVRATSWQIKNETEQETERKFVSGMIHLWAKYDGAQSTLNRRGEETRAWQLVTRPELDAVMTGLADEHGEVRGYLTEPGKDTVPMVWWPKMNGQWCANPSIKKLVGTTFNLEFKGKVQPDRSHRHYFFIKGAGET